MKKSLSLLVMFVSLNLFSQTGLKDFFKLSPPKRTWVLFHLFKAKKTLKISLKANKIADSIAKTNLLDGDKSGGQVDAFRHAYWMAILRQEIGKSAARSLGKAHEKENYLTFKKRELEDGVVPDEISSSMDLWNNEKGLELTRKGSTISKKGLIFRVINAIHQGKMKIIKKDKKGNFLSCEGKVISVNSLKGKWKNNKCLVGSDYKK